MLKKIVSLNIDSMENCGVELGRWTMGQRLLDDNVGVLAQSH